MAAAAVVISALAGTARPAHAAPADAAFTIANYPVDAVDANAVAAKEKALSDGQTAAFRALLKRIVPVTAYKQLARLSQIRASELVSGVSVRSERNSATQYLASLDFTYQAEAVRGLLQSHGIPFVDTQAPKIALVPVLKAADGSYTSAGGDWLTAWKGLDLEHTLTPAGIEELKAVVHKDTVDMVVRGDEGGQRILAGEYGSEAVVLAIAEPDAAAGKYHVTLAGQDGAGAFTLKRSYRANDGDMAYAAELAAVVSLGILEGRWKAVRAPQAVAGLPSAMPADMSAPAPVWSANTAPASGEQIRLGAQFASLAQWNEMRTQLLDTPGVENLEIATVSASNAELTLSYPGGARALANALGSRGLRLLDSGAGWMLSPTY